MWFRVTALCVLCGVFLTAADDLESSVELMAKTGSCTTPSFSPDGKRIAFLSNISGSPQIWTVAAAGGWPVQVTALNDPVASISWSPDGNWLAFTLAPGGGMNTQVYLIRPDGTGMRRLTAGGKETNRAGIWSNDGKWLAWTSNVKSGRSMDAYAYDMKTGESSHMADLKGTGGITDFSHDRKQAVLTRLRSRGSNDLYVRNLETGAETLLTPHEGPGSFGIGVFSTDGSTVYLSSNKDHDKSAVREGARERRSDSSDRHPGGCRITDCRDHRGRKDGGGAVEPGGAQRTPTDGFGHIEATARIEAPG